MSRMVPCFNPACWSRRVHHEMPDVPRGQRMCEVPNDWEGYAAFCSMMCAVEAGYMSLSPNGEVCKKCFVASGGNPIYHHDTWTCYRPEVVEEEFQRLWDEREARMQAFRERLERGEFSAKT